MKPYPLSALNHFTVPTAMNVCPSLRQLGGFIGHTDPLSVGGKGQVDCRMRSQT
jgi:hypothetical protein